MDKIRLDIIRCPCCGAEYLASEIFLPNEFFGRPKYLEKDPVTHKIIKDYGSQMNTIARYTCDYCDTPFSIYTTLKFSTAEDEKKNFNKLYKTDLTKYQEDK